MALKKETIAELAKRIGLKSDELETAIKAEGEVDISIDAEITVLDKTELQTLKNNEYNNGKANGVEMAVKTTKEKLGLDFTGKTVDGLVEAASKKALADAKLEPNEQVKELQTKLQTVQTTATEYETKLQAKENELSSLHINFELGSHIPSLGDNGPSLGNQEIIGLMKSNGYEFKKNDKGVLVATKAGVEVVDKLSNAVPLKDVITGFMTEKKLLQPEQQNGGRGGGNAGPSNGAKLSDIKATFKASGKSELGEEFKAAVADAVKANPDFDMNN